MSTTSARSSASSTLMATPAREAAQALVGGLQACAPRVDLGAYLAQSPHRRREGGLLSFLRTTGPEED
jgi:hypothetical protein